MPSGLEGEPSIRKDEASGELRVLMISKACYVAAYRRKLEELARFPGVRLTLIVPPYWRFTARKAELEPGNTTGYELVAENPVLNGHHHLHFYPQLWRHLARLRPHIVHIDEEPYDFVTFHTLRAARRAGARALFFTWQNLCRRFPPPFGLFERYALTRADAAIAGNRGAAQVLRSKGFARPLVVIPQFGVDAELYRPLPRPEPRGPFSIGYVGRLVEEKGLMVLLEAVAELAGDWRLTLVGHGPLRYEIEETVAALGLGERIHLVRAIASAEVPHCLNSLDVLVLPSLTMPNWKEQFGRVLVEAMACGVAVVGSDSGEIPHVVGNAGLIFPEGDAYALRKRLETLMADPALRASLAARGRERVLEHFTQRRVAEETHRLYSALLRQA